MQKEIMPTLNNKNIFLTILLALTGLWILSWVLPWQIWLGRAPWVRMIVSIIIFIVPGMAFSMVLANQRFNLSTHFTSGLAISILIISMLGLIGRIVQVPFHTIKIIFALIGAACLIIFIQQFHSNHPLYKPEKFSIVTFVTLLLLMGISSGLVFWNNTGLGAAQGDNFTYAAYLTNWQHAQPLSFKEIIYNSGAADWIRFWLALFPMTTALLASISNLHGILVLAVYLQPCLVVIAILSIYNLYADFIQSKPIAISALMLHIGFLFMLQGNLQPGGAFLYRISEDKVFAAFIIAPMFFLAVRFLLEKLTKQSVIFFLLIGTSLEFLHPVILAYSIFIAGLYVLFVTMFQKDYKKLIIISILLVLIILPAGSLRFIDAPWVSQHLFGLQYDLTKPGAFDLNYALKTGSIDLRISYIEGTPFYGFNLQRIQLQINPQKIWILHIITWSCLWILLTGLLWSAFNIKKNPIAPFITATCLFILMCAIPYTGWLVGYLVSARLLWRAPWLFPVGLIFLVMLDESIKFIYNKIFINKKIYISSESIVFGLSFLISAIMISYFFTYSYERLPTLEKINTHILEITSFSQIGDYLEQNIEKPAIFLASSANMENFLPGLSSKAKTIYFRNKALSPYPVDSKKIDDIFTTNYAISIEQRINNLKEYHIEYLIITKKALKNFFLLNPQFTLTKRLDDYWILHFQEKKP